MLAFLSQLFPGISTFFAVEPLIAIARLFLIVLGFVLAYLGFKGTLEPLIMIPMGIGMIAVNCGKLFLSGETADIIGSSIGAVYALAPRSMNPMLIILLGLLVALLEIVILQVITTHFFLQRVIHYSVCCHIHIITPFCLL